MSSLDSLPGDQRAVLQLVLGRGRSYDEIARLLSIDPGAVRERALAALDALGPQTKVPAPQRALITDYLLGQLPEGNLDEVRDRLAEYPSERAWARVVSSELASVANHPLPDIPVETSSARAAAQASTPAPAPAPAVPPLRVAGLGEDVAQPAPKRQSVLGRRRRQREQREQAETAPEVEQAEQPEPTPPPKPKPKPKPKPESTRRSSRFGGSVVIGGAVVIVIVLLFVVIHGLGGSKAKTPVASTPTTSTTSSTAAAASSSTTSTTSSAAKVVAQINLTPPAAGSKAAGIAEVLSEGATDGIAIVAQNVPANTTKPPNAYAVWLYNSPTDAHILGFVNPGVTSSGRLSTAGGLPTNASHFKQLIVTVETSSNPKTPGQIILQGTLTGL